MNRLRFALPVLAVLAVPFAVEGWLNARGPAPPSDPASESAGRALLRDVIEHHHGSDLRDRDLVRFRLTSRAPLRPTLLVSAAVDPRSRNADFVGSFLKTTDPRGAAAPGGPDGAFRYDGATEALTPAGSVPPDEDIEGNIRAIAPSIVFWSLVPWILDDPKAVVWSLPDARHGRRLVRRIAVRWPGEADWFVLEVDPREPRLTGLEFLDARATVFLRWRGEYDGLQPIDGAGFPDAWRFRPARQLLRFLTGGSDLFVFRYAPVR